MKKTILYFLFTLLSCSVGLAQNAPKKSPKAAAPAKTIKIVFQLTSPDTAVQRAMVRQIGNALTAAPTAKIEVVCHNQGIGFLQTSKTFQADKIKELKEKGVVFAACENTIRERKIDKSDIVPQAIFVPAGIIELAEKQMEGWAYIKAGF